MIVSLMHVRILPQQDIMWRQLLRPFLHAFLLLPRKEEKSEQFKVVLEEKTIFARSALHRPQKAQIGTY